MHVLRLTKLTVIIILQYVQIQNYIIKPEINIISYINYISIFKVCIEILRK